MTLGITTLKNSKLNYIQHKNTQPDNKNCINMYKTVLQFTHYAKFHCDDCRYAECRGATLKASTKTVLNNFHL